jgi:hypothetical protein
MSPENMQTIMPSLKLQGDIQSYLISLGFGKRAEDIACEITHMINTSEVIKPEIAEIYKNADQLEF